MVSHGKAGSSIAASFGELTEGEGNIVATRIGVIARELLGTGRAVETDETLHLACGTPQQPCSTERFSQPSATAYTVATLRAVEKQIFAASLYD